VADEANVYVANNSQLHYEMRKNIATYHDSVHKMRKIMTFRMS